LEKVRLKRLIGSIMLAIKKENNITNFNHQKNSIRSKKPYPMVIQSTRNKQILNNNFQPFPHKKERKYRIWKLVIWLDPTQLGTIQTKQLFMKEGSKICRRKKGHKEYFKVRRWAILSMNSAKVINIIWEKQINKIWKFLKLELCYINLNKDGLQNMNLGGEDPKRESWF